VSEIALPLPLKLWKQTAKEGHKYASINAFSVTSVLKAVLEKQFKVQFSMKWQQLTNVN
jgi:hypothetical protein